MVYHALQSLDGKIEWNARFSVGDDVISQLEHGKIYTRRQLDEMAGIRWTMLDINQKRWRYVREEL